MFELCCCCPASLRSYGNVTGPGPNLAARVMVWVSIGVCCGISRQHLQQVLGSNRNSHLTKVGMHSQHTHKPEALRPLLKCLCRADHLLRRAPLKMLPRCRVSGAPRFNGARENASPAYCTKANSVQIRLNSDVAAALTIRLNAVICYNIL